MSNSNSVRDAYILAKRQDAKTGKWLFGRQSIVKNTGLSEWEVRRIIGEVRGVGTSAAPAKTPVQKALAKKEIEQLSLPQIVVNIPSFKPAKSPSTSVKHWVIGSDFHVPYVHEKSLDIFYQIISEIKPEKVILLGDMLNLDQFSKYDESKSPNLPTWLDEIEGVAEILGGVFSAIGRSDTKVDWYEGNHEMRLKKHLLRHDPILYSHLDIPKLFHISGNKEAEKLISNLSYIEAAEVFQKDLGIIIKHGEKVRKHAGMSVQAEVDGLLTSVIMGHCHRLGLYNRSSGLSRFFNQQPLFGMETGCMCRYDIPYIGESTTNWQHGFGILTIDTSERPFVSQPEIVSINNGKALFRGKTYRA